MVRQLELERVKLNSESTSVAVFSSPEKSTAALEKYCSIFRLFVVNIVLL